jgi:sulfur-oxidizing protein SoxX
MKAIFYAVVIVFGLSGDVLAQSSSWGAGANDNTFGELLRTSFRDRNAVKTDRLQQDETQAFCSDPVAAAAPANAKRAEAIEQANLAAVKFPADGQYLGDWRRGETIAQSGRGLTWTDSATQVSGGNCYNCHQISASEISYGTIGPSLLGYGKLRGIEADVLRATWAKIYNSKSSNACSNMPRAGHMGILNETQLKDVMALLLDPASPVNK